MRRLHLVLAVLAAALVLLVIVANASCAPKYFQRGDVIALLSLGVGYALVLGWAGLRDTDARRAVGAIGSAGLAALFVSTASIPLLAAPLAIVGAFRLPRSDRTRWWLVLAAPFIIVATFALLVLGQSSVTADQFRCP